MPVRAKIEAIIYAAEEPVTVEQVFALVKDDLRQELLRLRQPAPGAQSETPESVA